MPPTSKYDAFISYSHQDDAVVGPALQAGLERFAKPWYQMRGLRVFRDTANLAANPALWASIEDALSSSRWLVLLASAGAARSAWVNREVEWWMAHRTAERLLVVATSPGLSWDSQEHDWASGAMVPPALRGAFTDEPLWIDLTDIQPDGHRSGIPPERLAALAAPIRGVPKDALFGEHLREHRRTMRLARGAVAVLATLTVLAIAAFVIAVGQRDTARTQARLATSRELAALAVENVNVHLDVAQLLAVAAFKMDGNPQTRAALLQVVAASPHLVKYLQVGSQVTALAGSADGGVATAGTADGDLVWFDTATGQRAEVRASRGSITDVALSADGRVVVAASGSKAVIWKVGQRQVTTVEAGHLVNSVAVSPSGRLAAVLDNAGTPSASLIIRDDHSSKVIRASVPGSYTSIGFPGESSLSLIEGLVAQLREAPSLRVISTSPVIPCLPAGGYVLGTSPNGKYVGFAKAGYVTVWPAEKCLSSVVNAIAAVRVASGLEISPDGKSVALVASGTIYVARLSGRAGLPPASDVTQLTGGGDITAVKFLGGSDGQLVSSSGTSLELWDLRQNSRLGHSTGISIPDAGTVGLAPSLAFSPDARFLAIVSGFGDTVSSYRNGTRFTLAANASFDIAANSGPVKINGPPLWRGDDLLLLGADNAGRLMVISDSGKIIASRSNWPKDSGVLTARLLPEQQLAVVDDNGGIQIYDLRTKTVRQVTADLSAVKNNTDTLFQANISSDGKAAVITEWHADTLTSPFTPLRVLYFDLRTGASHVVGSGGALAAVFADGRLLVQRSAGPLEIWDLSGKRLLQILPGAGGLTSNLAVSPSGTLLARLRDDGTASITDLATGEVLATFSLPVPSRTVASDPWGATNLAFTPEGADLLTASSGGALTRWPIAAADLIKEACATAGRNLTASEWREYLQSNPPAGLSCPNASAPSVLGEPTGMRAAGANVPVTPCPVSHEPQTPTPPTAPPSVVLPSSVALPPGAAVYGAGEPYGTFPGQSGMTFSIAPTEFHCSGDATRADGTFDVLLTAPSNRGGSVGYEFSAGGTDPGYVCPFFPAIASLFYSASQQRAYCTPPVGEIITQIPTGKPHLWVATVLDPPGVPLKVGLSPGSGEVLHVFVVSSDGLVQDGECSLPPGQRQICVAGLDYFVTQTIAAQAGPATVAAIQAGIGSMADR